MYILREVIIDGGAYEVRVYEAGEYQTEGYDKYLYDNDSPDRLMPPEHYKRHVAYGNVKTAVQFGKPIVLTRAAVILCHKSAPIFNEYGEVAP